MTAIVSAVGSLPDITGSDVRTVTRVAGAGRSTPDTATDDGPAINTVLNAASGAAVAGSRGTVYLPPGCYNIKTTVQLPPGIMLTGGGSGSPASRPGTSLYGDATLSGAVIASQTGKFMHHAGITRLAVRNGPSHGIAIDSAGENFIIDQVSAQSNAGDGIRITGPSTPLHIGRVSVHLNGGAGVALVGQLATHVQIQYVAGDNNGVALVHVNGLDTSGSVHVHDWKAERWNSGTPGHPDVFLINNGNGGLVNLGQGRVHVGSGVTAGTNLIHQTAGVGASVARVKWRIAYHNVDGSPDYTNGYRDDLNNITLTVAQTIRATVASNEAYGAITVGSFTKIAEAVGGAALYYAAGSPISSLAANPGSLCLSANGSGYYKQTGTTSSGWVTIGLGASSRYPIAAGTRSTKYLCPTGGGSSTHAHTQGTPRYTPIWVPAAVTIDQIGLEVTTAGTSGTAVIRLGLYADDGNGYPSGSPLLDAGTIDAGSTGFKTISTSLALAAGLYWGCATAQGSPAALPTVRAITGFVPGVVAFTAQPNVAGYTDSNTVTGALGTPSINGNGTASPLVMLRVQ